jgi:hypothetical protein
LTYKIFPETKVQESAKIIQSINFDQNQILADIINLHTGLIELDPCYGSGVFWKKLPKPKYCFDLNPRKPGIVSADVRHLPLKDNSISSAIFDPPFLARTGPGATLKARFGELVGTIQVLWEIYYDGMEELYRVLKPKGWMVVKCQDGVLSGKNNNTYGKICNKAEELGFVWKDLFILCATHRMMHPKHLIQRHARKYHSYFVIFYKK